MSIVQDIFKSFGGATPLATELGEAVSTVHDWKKRDAIPRWRRGSILAIADKAKEPLSERAKRYLASSERVAA